MGRTLNTLLLAIFVAAIVVASYWLGQQAYSWMPSQGTAEAKLVDDIFSFLVTIGAFIFLGIVGFISYSILTCRADQEDFSDARPDRENKKIQALWTVIPTLLVLWVAIQSYKIYQQIDIQGLTPIAHMHLMAEPAYAATVNNVNKPAEEVEVVARQWAWSFRYPGQNITSTELHLPVNQSIRLAMRSTDVLHGFYVPEFRIKQDILPNSTITLVLIPLREGKYRLRDSQFSGTYFALMEADVYVDSPEAYTRWLTEASTHAPTPAKNQAASEYAQKLQDKGRRRSWPTVVPAQPPVVNYSSLGR